MHSTRSYGSLGICFLALVCFLISIAAVDGANLYPQVPSSASFTPSSHLGSFILTPNLRIVVHKDPLVGAEPPAPTIVDYAQSFWSDLSAVASFSLPPIIVVDNDSVTPGVEDSDSVISISVNTTLSYQYFNGKPSLEGYDIRVTPSVLTIQAASPLGVWWGTRTVIQQVALSLENLGHASEVNDTNITLPLGYLSDSPGWEVRGFMLDAGRHWFDAGFLAELCVYASFFKLNEFHLHASDNLWNPAFLYGEGNEGWKDLYAAFRFRPSKGSPIEGLVPSYRLNETWSKDDFSTMQNTCARHGITIIPEIDTPGHSLVITQWKPELMETGQPDHLNLSHPDTIPTIKSIWDEFLPWFSSPEISIGADEYDAALANDYISFVNDMSAYIHLQSGKSIRVWGTNEPSRTLSISTNVTIQHWDFPGDDIPIQLMQSGYQVINSEQFFLYLDEKTSENNQFPQTLNEDLIWGGAPDGKGWAPNIFSPTNASNNTSVDNPNLRGSIMALWCDWGNNATTRLEIYYQLARSLAVFAEKSWSGSDDVRRSGLTREEFDKVYPILNAAAPGQNLNRVVKPLHGNIVYEYATPELPLTTPVGSVGPPYTLSFSVKPSSKSPNIGLLFSGIDSKLHISNLTFEATGQLYSLGYTLPMEKYTQVTIRATKDYTYAIFDGDEQNKWFWTTSMDIWGDYIAIGNMSFAAPAKELGGEHFEGSLRNVSLVLVPQDEAL